MQLVDVKHKNKMLSAEKFCLKWNDFQDNLNSAFAGLRNDQDLTDVTLACEDGTQFQTHKVILASSSPFFMELLKTNKHPHPLLYMRGLKNEDLAAMIDFLYFGEVNVNQERLDVFFALAEELKLKGLTNSSEKNVEDAEMELGTTEKKLEQKLQYDTSTLNEAKLLEVCSSNTTRMSSLGALVNTEPDQLDSQINSMMTITEKRLTYGNRTKAVFLCNVCGKEGKKTNIVSHIEANHITSNVSYSCDICGKTSRSRDGLRFHKRSQHPKFSGPKTA